MCAGLADMNHTHSWARRLPESSQESHAEVLRGKLTSDIMDIWWRSYAQRLVLCIPCNVITTLGGHMHGSQHVCIYTTRVGVREREIFSHKPADLFIMLRTRVCAPLHTYDIPHTCFVCFVCVCVLYNFTFDACARNNVRRRHSGQHWRQAIPKPYTLWDDDGDDDKRTTIALLLASAHAR